MPAQEGERRLLHVLPLMTERHRRDRRRLRARPGVSFHDRADQLQLRDHHAFLREQQRGARCLQQPAGVQHARVVEPRGDPLAERDAGLSRHAEQGEVLACPGRHLVKRRIEPPVHDRVPGDPVRREVHGERVEAGVDQPVPVKVALLAELHERL